ATFRKTVKIHHSRVTQHFGQFVEHLVGVQQNVIGLDEPDKEVKGQSSCTVVRANEDCGVENDSQ
ncbi:MAG: hypothetical protein ACOYMN_22855, partial [Roseimicrobium sp.]